ncbi:MAG: hypothetical protein Q8N30_10625 [Methylococcales bacterium]|nr:hypothetical protein [Methylococcales bacterium]
MKFGFYWIIPFVIWLSISIVNADNDTRTNGNDSPAISGDDNTVIYNYGFSAKDVERIIVGYTKQRQIDTQQIKYLQSVITTLMQGKAGTEPQIRTALNSLEHGDASLAQKLLGKGVFCCDSKDNHRCPVITRTPQQVGTPCLHLLAL